MTDFVARLIALRHSLPTLQHRQFFTGAPDPVTRVADVRWLSPAGADMTPETWEEADGRTLGVLLNGRMHRNIGADAPQAAATPLILNSHDGVVQFRLPEAGRWNLLVDTTRPELTAGTVLEAGHVYDVAGRSLLLFSSD